MKSGIRPVFAIFLLMFSYSFLTGCERSYYLVTSDFVVTDNKEAPPEIVESQTYRMVIPKIKSLTVKAPEGCADETATQSSGEASSRGILLKTTCGIEMAELERSLTKTGFQVISWKALQNMVLKEEITPQAASKELGAEVLFQINSLERSLVQAGQDARWERRFYKSNEVGEQIKPIAIPAKEGNQLISYVKKKEASLTPPERLSVTINASASLVETGETIWFYEWTHAEEQGRAEAMNVLTVCDDEICGDPPSKDKNQPEEDLFVSGNSEAISQQKNAEDRQNAFYHQLLRELVTNLANSFKHPS